MLHPVVLNGGSGSRLWPLSRQNQPKQFLALIGSHSLFQETLRRASTLPDVRLPVVVCAEDHRFMVGEQLQEIGLASGGILLEPVARNTAPAIAIAALHVAAADPAALMLVLPADHLIEDEAAFREAVVRALPLAREGWLVTFGIEPDAPETGYGYIEFPENVRPGSLTAFPVHRFREKPELKAAKRYVAAGNYAWNGGMFFWRAATLLEELQKYLPKSCTGT